MTARWSRLPLRFQLVALLVVLVTAGLALSGAAATSALHGYLLGRVDEQLADVVSDLGRRPIDTAGPGRGLPTQYYVAVLDPQGNLSQVLGRRGERATGAPDVLGTTLAQVAARAGAPYTVGAVDGAGTWRVVGLTLRGDVGTVLVASDLREVDRTTDRLVLLLLGVGLGVVGVLGVVGHAVVRRSLRPLVEVEEAAAAVAAGDLARRAPARDPRTEVGSLAASFNGMVEQVEVAFATRAASEERVRRFAADASHELRTPLTSIRGFAELYRQGAVPGPEDVARVMARIEDESVRMTALVEDLLRLARLDQERPLEVEPVDLVVLCADAAHDAQALDPGREVRFVQVPGEGGTTVLGDEATLRQVFTNLLGNAVLHTPAGTPVTVTLGAVRLDGRDWVQVEVADTGPGLAPQDAERVFERFFRVEGSRTRAAGRGGGSGLGLSVVQAVVTAHGGTVDVASTLGRGTTFRVRLPAG